jgi:hypothetical protein
MLNSTFLSRYLAGVHPVDLFRPCILLLIIVSAGCAARTKGPVRVAVQGQVTIDGEPLETGLIKFIPSGVTKGPVAVLPIKKGIYKCNPSEGPVQGAHRVEIAPGLDEALAGLAANPKAFEKHLRESGNTVHTPPLPQRYNRQSTLAAEITPGGQRTFDFELENSDTATESG